MNLEIRPGSIAGHRSRAGAMAHRGFSLPSSSALLSFVKTTPFPSPGRTRSNSGCSCPRAPQSQGRRERHCSYLEGNEGDLIRPPVSLQIELFQLASHMWCWRMRVTEQVEPITGDYPQETEALACVSEGSLCSRGFVGRWKKWTVYLQAWTDFMWKLWGDNQCEIPCHGFQNKNHNFNKLGESSLYLCLILFNGNCFLSIFKPQDLWWTRVFWHYMSRKSFDIYLLFLFIFSVYQAK